MKERPILFNAEMVRAVIDGRKNQTRRVVKELPGGRGGPVGDHVRYWRRGEEDPDRWCGCDGLGSIGWLMCPYGKPGDRLWVRETWWQGTGPTYGSNCVVYDADRAQGWSRGSFDIGPGTDLRRQFRKRPSIYMPRWASRITLEVNDVRVERVQDITADDIDAEGVDNGYTNRLMGRRHENAQMMAWEKLWDSINGARGFGWVANPWVWVVSFKVLETKA